MSESKHTPGIAYIDHYTDQLIIDIDGKKYALAEVYAPIARSKGRNGTVEAKANAERFAQCWNEYDELKAENERLKKQVDNLLETGSSKLTIDQTGNLEALNRELADALRDILPYLKAPGTNGNHFAPQVETLIAKYNSTK